MRIDLGKVLKFLLLNIAIFYGLKWYYDGRQTRLVDTLLPSVVKVSPIGDVYKYYIVMNEEGIFIKKKRVGWGPMGHGSGVFVSKSGLLLTCAHVVEDSPLVEVRLTGGKLIKAYVLARDPEHDVALLKLVKPQVGIQSVSLGKEPKKGLSVLTIGYPGPFLNYVTQGVISGYKDTDTYSDACIAPGNSGGGVFTIDGKLVGLSRAMTGPVNIPTYQGFSMFSSIRYIKDLVHKYEGF